MAYLINQVSIYSIFLPFAMAVIRFHKIHRIYYPFLLLILFGLINESVGSYIIYRGGSNAVPFNIYSLLEALLVIWQFRSWNLFSGRSAIAILSAFTLIWAAEIFFISGITMFCSYFIVVTAFTITLLSIFMINHLIISERRNLLKNPMFIISVCFVIYFAYSLLVEFFMMNSSGNDVDFQVRIHQIFDITNLFTHLLYTLAIIWMPTRLRFTLPY